MNTSTTYCIKVVKEICRKKNGKSSIWFDQHINFLLRNWTVMKHLFWSVSKFEVLVLSYLLTYFSHMRSIQHEYLEFRFLQTVPPCPFPLFISAFFLCQNHFNWECIFLSISTCIYKMLVNLCKAITCSEL